MNIYFVRHCEYSNPRNILPGRLPVPLSERGLSQAEKLKTYFADKHIEKIYSSAVMRARQTSEIIAGGQIPIVYDTRLLETFSAYQGMWFERDLDWSHFFGHRRELGGESYTDIQTRITSFFNEITQGKESNLVVCSHGDPLYLLYLSLTHQPLPDESEEPGIFSHVNYQLKGSVRHVEFNHGTLNVAPIIVNERL